MTKKYILLLLFIFSTFGAIHSQKKDAYIPLLDTTKTWTEAMRTVKGGNFFTQDFSLSTVTHNGGKLYKVNDGNNHYYRENVEERKVYRRTNLDGTEQLIFDFSLEEGNSVTVLGSSVCNVDSIKYTNGIYRTLYLHSGSTNVVWIEGVGSINKFLIPNEEQFDEEVGLTCCKKGDDYLYHSKLAQHYGCHYYEMDDVPPKIQSIKLNKDTVAINQKNIIQITVSDWSQTIKDILVKVVSPSNTEFTFGNPNTQYFGDIGNYFDSFSIVKITNEELGDWYISEIKVIDKYDNVTTKTYSPFELKYHVREPLGVKTQDANKISIYPNPAGNILKIENISDFKNKKISVYNVFGTKIHEHIITDDSSIDVSDLNSGIYFIKIIANNNILLTQKFIKL